MMNEKDKERVYYQVEMNEDNSGEKLSEGRVGGGWSTIASINSKTLLHVSSSSGGKYGNFPVAHSSTTNPKLHISLLLPYLFPTILSGC